MEAPVILEQYIIPWGIRIVLALAILLVGSLLTRLLSQMARQTMLKSRLDVTLANFLGSLIYSVLLIAVILAAIDNIGINVTSLLAILGAAGLAVGLALKDSLSNFAAGVMIILFRPFKTGDVITAAGTSGSVDEINLFCTFMRTADNQRIIVPNRTVFSGTIINASALPTRRIDLVVGIRMEDNVNQARQIILSVLQTEPGVLKEPAPQVAVTELLNNSTRLHVRPWVNTADYHPTRFSLLERIKVELDKAGIVTLSSTGG